MAIWGWTEWNPKLEMADEADAAVEGLEAPGEGAKTDRGEVAIADKHQDGEECQ